MMNLIEMRVKSSSSVIAEKKILLLSLNSELILRGRMILKWCLVAQSS